MLRRTVARYLAEYGRGGFEALLERTLLSPYQLPSMRLLLKKELSSKLAKGTFRTSKQVQQWLKETHKIERAQSSLYLWLKSGVALLVPRSVHIKKDQQKSDSFPDQVSQKLDALALAAERPVQVWVQDEGRFGLQHHCSASLGPQRQAHR